MMGASADHVVAAAAAVGIDKQLPQAVQRLCHHAIQSGYGADGGTRTVAAAEIPVGRDGAPTFATAALRA